MPSSKSSKSTGSAKGGAKRPQRPGTQGKPTKPKPKPPTDPFGAEPPIVITGGSVEIQLDTSVFPPDPADPKRHKNSGRKLKSLEIQDTSGTPATLMTLDLDALFGGKCKIVVRYTT